ncbi:GNAT family N-acetyltransferase [Paucibacter sp. APW11]|uniref:GNAT family N-acetyltransferase n=1 Tax=Roseateles aquae TaxID=3077235 RepID=A0ABU3P7B9_9BURK|nr:GNAT family N-acetyltransferase [Paucibacter sp. APW11]MDT8998444.1 GNAT family N-acetyltransferase [Paucibacter sp. APW11]
MAASTTLYTDRLLLRAAGPALAEALADFHLRNAAHLAPWDPPSPPGFFDTEAVRERLALAGQAFEQGSGYRYLICLREAPDRVIGQCNFSQVSRGPFQNTILGYSLDAQLQGQGLMAEGLRAGCAEMFSERVRLHRIQAGVRPENARSRATLLRLGFALEGHSKRYLFINGAWRDHDLFALLHPSWPDDQPPA